MNYNNNGYNNGYSNQPNQMKKAKSGAKYVTWVNEKGEKGEKVIGWQIRKGKGYREVEAFPLTEETLKKRRKENGYSKDYGFLTQKNNERWWCTISDKDSGEIIGTTGYFKRNEKKLYIPRFSLVVSCNSVRKHTIGQGYMGNAAVKR